VVGRPVAALALGRDGAIGSARELRVRLQHDEKAEDVALRQDEDARDGSLVGS
jgi:hypothetical protein